MTNFEVDRKGFEERDAQVLSVSADSVFSHKAFVEKMGSIGYSMLSDSYRHGVITALYDCLRPEGYPRRVIFIIDEQRIVRYCQVYEKGIPENKDLFAELDKINRS